MRNRRYAAAVLGCISAVVIVSVLPWAHIVREVHAHWRLELAVVGVAGLAVAGWLLRPAAAPVAARTGSAEPTRWLTDRRIAWAAGSVMVLGLTTLIVLLFVAGGATPDKRAELTIEAIKYGLGAIASAGAVAGLLLAVRRQHLSERVHEHTERDAAERQVTEIYTKAVEQLGSSDAAVRLGGLYALERVAQNNVQQRQTVVNVLCAYLGMPFEPPPTSFEQTASNARLGPARDAAESSRRDPVEELRVRNTAQRILHRHLSLPDGVDAAGAAAVRQEPEQQYWHGIDIDLTRATLVEWYMPRACVRTANFSMARFVGTACFTGTAVTGWVKFEGANFAGEARLDAIAVDNDASFELAVFADRADFRRAVFGGGTVYDGAKFAREVLFDEARFVGRAGFASVEFAGDGGFVATRFESAADFLHSTFACGTRYRGATFAADARFVDARFTGATDFEGVRFTDAAFAKAVFEATVDFGGAAFRGGAGFVDATFNGDAGFARATFVGRAGFERATFDGAARLEDARVLRGEGRTDVWPPGWRVVPGPADWDYAHLVFTGAANGTAH